MAFHCFFYSIHLLHCMTQTFDYFVTLQPWKKGHVIRLLPGSEIGLTAMSQTALCCDNGEGNAGQITWERRLREKKNSKMLTSPFSLAFVQRPILLEKPLWGVWIVECVLRSVNLCCDVNALIDHRSQRRWKRSHKETLKSSKNNNN